MGGFFPTKRNGQEEKEEKEKEKNGIGKSNRERKEMVGEKRV